MLPGRWRTVCRPAPSMIIGLGLIPSADYSVSDLQKHLVAVYARLHSDLLCIVYMQSSVQQHIVKSIWEATGVMHATRVPCADGGARDGIWRGGAVHACGEAAGAGAARARV